MAVATQDRSLGDLLRELSNETGDLLRKEVELAKTEFSEKASRVGTDVGAIAMGGAMALAGGLALMLAAVYGLTALLDTFLPLGVAVWLAPLILTLIFGGIGLSKVRGALEKLSHESLVPRKTIETLKDDARWAERKVHS